MMLKSIIQDNKIFFILQLLLFLLGSYPLLVYNKVTLLLQLNSYNHSFFDYFFYYITFLGSNITYVFFMALLVVMKQDNRTLLIGISSFGMMSAIIQGVKRIEFFEQLRPITSIPAETSLHLVGGIIHKSYWSFPSGHTGAFFTIVWLIHLLAPVKPWWFSIFLCLLACIVAYSRLYLCQHFYRDIYVGALIGTCITISAYTFLKHWQGPAWLDQTPLDVFPFKWKQKLERFFSF